MRHRNRGRKLGRNPSHQRALLRNLASALLLTARDADRDEERDSLGFSGKRRWRLYGEKESAPKVPGRIVTTLQKAKEVRPLVEKCITIARRSIAAQREADEHATGAERGSDAWTEWRQGDGWRQWNQAIAPVLAARRRTLKLLGDIQAVTVLFDEVAPRFEDRAGGYTRVVRLATPRLGDGGQRAILELVGVRDRVQQKSEAPAFEDDQPEESAPAAEDSAAEDSAADATAEPEAAAGESAADEDDGQDAEKKEQ